MSKKLIDLKKQRAEVLKKQDELAKRVKTEERIFSDDENKELAALEAEEKRLTDEIDQLEVAEKAQRERLAALDERRKQIGTDIGGRGTVDIEITREEGEDNEGRCIVYKSFGEQIKDVVRNCRQPSQRIDRLERCQRIMTRATGLSEGVAQDGGYLLQTDYASTLFDRTYNEGQIARLCERNGVAGNGIKIPAIDENSRANGQRYGGVQVYWENEADTVTATKPKLRLMQLVLKKLLGAFVLTDELMEDVNFLAAYVSRLFVKEFAFKVDDAVFRGTGSGQMLGITKAACLYDVAKESGQAADTVLFNNITKMEAAMWAPGLGNSTWMINKNVKPQLQSMLIPNTSIPAYLPPSGLAGQGYATLYGRPCLVNEYSNKLGDAGDITLNDFSQYQIIDKGSLQQAQSIHVYFLQAEQVLRFVMRIDGQPLWDAALTPYQAESGEKESPFIRLAERA